MDVCPIAIPVIPSHHTNPPSPCSFKKTPGFSVPSMPSVGPTEVVGDDAPKEKRALRCVQCQHVITTEEARTQVQGRHLFRFTNPHGFDYEIGCFKQASGCLPEGPPTDTFTWFPGYTWQIQRCRGCLLHMGWRYENDESAFFGLILTQLLSA